MATEAKAKKVFDVAEPGKTVPDASSRPLIVGSGTMLEDPMMAKADAAAPAIKISVSAVGPAPDTAAPTEPAPSAPPLSSSNRVKITPLSQQESTAHQASAETEPPAQPSVSDTAVVDAVISQANPAKKEKDTATDEQETAKSASIAQAIESKKYFVAIGDSKHDRSLNRWLITILTLLLLAIVIVNFAIDAELIQTNIQPITDLIEN